MFQRFTTSQSESIVHEHWKTIFFYCFLKLESFLSLLRSVECGVHIDVISTNQSLAPSVWVGVLLLLCRISVSSTINKEWEKRQRRWVSERWNCAHISWLYPLTVMNSDVTLRSVYACVGRLWVYAVCIQTGGTSYDLFYGNVRKDVFVHRWKHSAIGNEHKNML